MIEIAIDGTAASGKGTLGKKLSDKYGFPYLDTGMLYRKVAYDLIKNEMTSLKNLEENSCNFAKILVFNELKNENLRSEYIAKLASNIATYRSLRNILNEKQKEFNDLNKKQFGGCILDGRDIGARVCPNADIKFYITASLEVRAKRRWIETIKLNPSETLSKVKADLMKRDTRDRSRSLAPLLKAEDALLIDTSELTIDASVKLFIDAVNEKLNN